LLRLYLFNQAKLVGQRAARSMQQAGKFIDNSSLL